MVDNIKRLAGDSYKRPTVTYTDRLTEEQIRDQLQDYAQIKDISKVKLGSHIKYFSDVGGEKKFRVGGTLINNSGLPDYVVLLNGKSTWSVQTKNTIFFRQITISDIKEEYEEIIQNKDKEIIKLKNKIQVLSEKLK